ncbi:MAG: ABC transporter substrate-binding protein [Patescibacteria group bacterium]
MSKRVIALVCLGAAVALLLALMPAPLAAAGKVTISIMGKNNEAGDFLNDTFKKENPNIEIQYVEADMTRYFAMNAAGDPPDLLRVYGSSVPMLAARKLLLDLTPYFRASDVLKLSDLSPVADLYKFDGKRQGKGAIYGMPKDWSPDMTIFYNKKMLKDAGIPYPSATVPMTYTQFAEMQKKLTKREGDRVIVYGGSSFPLTDGWGEQYLKFMCASNGVSIYSNDFKRINLVNNTEVKKALNWYIDLAKAHAIPNPLDPPSDWDGALFVAGKIAVQQYGYWFGAMAESDITPEVGMAPAPVWGKKRLSPCITATGYVISKKTKHPKEAWQVFEWYMGKSAARNRAATGWGVPTSKSMFSLMPQGTPFAKSNYDVVQGEMKYFTILPNNPYLDRNAVDSAFNKHWENVLRGAETLDAALKAIEDEVNRAIAEGVARLGD